MVSVPQEATFDPDMIRQLIVEGMEVARINLSQGSPEEWLMLINHVREQSSLLKLDCKIKIDLIGPQLTIGKIKIHKGAKKFQGS